MPEGELSQDDIDSLLGITAGGAAPPEGAGPEEVQAGLEAAEPPRAAARPVSAGVPLDSEQAAEAFALLKDVPLNVRIELGRNKMYLEDILKLDKGSVVELDKLAGDPLDILVNDRLVAKGELIVLDDYFCIRVTEIVSPEKRRELDAR